MSIDFRETVNGHDFLRVFERICNSACLHPSHLDHLGKCVHEFLPLIQTITVVRSVTERIQNLLEQYHRFSRSMDEESPRKKRKVDNDSADNDVTKATTLAFSTAAIFTSVVLSSFSASSVPKESQPELETLLTSFSSKVVLHSLSRMVKGVSKTNRTSSWDDEVVMRGNLRLRYALSLGLERSPSITINVECPSKLTQRLFESIDKIMLPELQLEILRTLFQCAPVGQQPALLDVTLRILETDEPPEMINVLHMVIQRWFPLIDLHASKAQLERFVVLLVNIQTRSGENAMKILMNQALSSAEFWELSEVRIILLAFIEQSISDICNWTTATLHEKEVVHSVFNILSFIPTEYLSRTLRLSLVKRAILFDQTMTSMNDAGLLHTLRVCVSRSISSADLSDNLMGDLAVYLQRLHNAEVNVESFLQTTELIRLLLKNLFKSNDSKEIGQLIQHYSDGLQSSHFSPLNPWARSFEIVVELLMKGYPMKSFSNSVQDKFKELYDALHQSLLPSLVELMNKPSALKVTQARGLLEGWQRVLKLGRWLGITDIAVFGENIDQLFAFAKLSGDENAGSIVFGVLLEEFNFCAVNLQPQRFEIVVAAYVLLAKDRPVASLSSIDSSISSLCPTLSVDIFKHGMDFIVASLKCAKEEDSGALVHVLSILIQESPQNTFHMVQIFVTESINIFNDREIFTDKIRLPALRLLLQRCRDRPATLRLADISGIWLFIAKSCADAETHDPTTSAETFHCIVSITTTLVRLRRDLVLLTIPHLGVVLRYLIQSMRSPRLNLGPKQSAVVSRGLPPWINIQDPLSAEEAKALSRLLESLNTKSIIRKLTTSTAAPPKAESLAKPFSKHAAYVIKAYVKSLNDPLCAIPAVVRKELQPGLYALCGMMNDFGRDALMASATDAGEKAIVKALWREYEKQRYVGKG
ncbi:Urb2/Npa2 family-domain-containing protein [Lentinula aciculospora]|uniref:Urb2/Npa2 family-domain-containing protein n=1 Tax=Lentinula aciculospora TaxID=153920 RepID=A0A9W9A9E4_9AGAR|nr:Urb2/Npa2 family-domain-containing protein [Lentinula aciculospora]